MIPAAILIALALGWSLGSGGGGGSNGGGGGGPSGSVININVIGSEGSRATPAKVDFGR